MRTAILIASLMFTVHAWATARAVSSTFRHHTMMAPAGGWKSYPTLELDQLPVAGNWHYVKGWRRPLHDINRVSAIVHDASGYYIAGTTVNFRNIQVTFNHKAVDSVLGGYFGDASSGNKSVFSVKAAHKIAVTLFHLSPDGKVLWARTFKNDLVDSGPMTRLKDGRLLLALTPLMVDKDTEFSSFLFFISADGKIEKREQFKNVLFNSLLATANGEVLAGVVRRERLKGKSKMGLDQYAYFLDSNGRKRRDVYLSDGPGDGVVFNALTVAKEYSDAYVLGGANSVFTISKQGKATQWTFLMPYFHGDGDYYLKALRRDRHKNLALFGTYGHQANPVAETELNDLRSVTGPTADPDLTNANIRLRRNPLLRSVYNQTLEEMKASAERSGRPFDAVVTADQRLINVIDRHQQNSLFGYAGAGSDHGLFLIERIGGRREQKYYLLDAKERLLGRGKLAVPLCEYRCRLYGSTLVHLEWDPKLPGFSVDEGKFAPAKAKSRHH